MAGSWFSDLYVNFLPKGKGVYREVAKSAKQCMDFCFKFPNPSRPSRLGGSRVLYWFGLVRVGNRKGLTVIDAAITICLIGVLIGIVIPKYQRMAHVAQETALKSALSNIRTSIRLFKMLNGRNPMSLNELIEKNVMLPARIGSDPYTGSILDQKYLMSIAMDKKGNIIDTFGNPFEYDSSRGEVRTTTKGYETW